MWRDSLKLTDAFSAGDRANAFRRGGSNGLPEQGVRGKDAQPDHQLVIAKVSQAHLINNARCPACILR